MDGQSKPANAHRGRPGISEGYGIAKEDSGLLDWSFVDERMASSHNYWIATTRGDGRPHAAPVWGVWFDDTFFFSTDAQSAKGRNLARSPELVVHLESGDEAVIIEGTVRAETSRETLGKYSDAYDDKYNFRPDVDDPDAGVVYRVEPHAVLAWRERDFPQSATRWVFDG